ncbi:hypothetical protein NCS52_00993800 [Fusarium sp. LHS14.1]|nr:hypothetical protein NCS52_00993800 [Fusarium sp. LHS14.1]
MSTPEHKHWLTLYEVRHGVYAVIRAEVQLHLHEILHHIPPRGFSQLDRFQALDFRNKTIPVYLLTGDAEKRGLSGLLLMVIHNYLYRKWFRPYRSDIERGQFVAKVILTTDQPDTKDEESAVDLAMQMHPTINTCLDSIKAQQFYTTRPLFRAMAIVIPGQSYYTCGLVSRVATMSVLIILTGEQKGLSAPISFDSIADRAETVTIGGKGGVRTNLKTAIDFVMFLEQREEAALGPQPDPIASTDASALDDWEGGWIYEGPNTPTGLGKELRWMPSSPSAWNKMGGGSMHMIAVAVIMRVL